MKVKGIICAFILCIVCVILFFIVKGMYNKKTSMGDYYGINKYIYRD